MQQQQGTTIAQKIEIGANIAFTIAFPVMVLLRRRMGYRFISQPRLIVAALIFWALATFVAGSAASVAAANKACTGELGSTCTYPTSTEITAASYGSNAWLIIVFTLAFLAWGLLSRWLRWQDIKKGINWHSKSRGISWFQKIVPLSDSNIKRFIDPLATLLVGCLFYFTHFQTLIGLYLIIAAFCLFAWEAYDYERSINLMLDQLDALIDSEVISENTEYYMQPNPKQRPLDQTAGIPTGVAPDLQAALERRKNRVVPAAVGAPVNQPMP